MFKALKKMTKGYKTRGCDCGCWYACCCSPCAISEIGKKIGAEDTHNFNTACFNGMCLSAGNPIALIGLCACPELTGGTYLSILMDKSMAYHGIDEVPFYCCAGKTCDGASCWYYNDTFLCAPCIINAMLQEPAR